MCRSDDACNAGFILIVRTCDDFGMGNFVLIVGMKEFGKFMWGDNKKELISIFGYARKVPCECMKYAMRRYKAHVQKAKFPHKILSTLENA